MLWVQEFGKNTQRHASYSCNNRVIDKKTPKNRLTVDFKGDLKTKKPQNGARCKLTQRIDLLTDLVNLVRGGAEPLKLTEILNPHILPEDITGKQIVLDVRALDSRGRSIDVEVQLRCSWN